MSNPYLQTDLENETKNFKAFDHLTTALTRIDDYQLSKKEEQLKQAADFISKALDADKNYFKARYFEAVVNYLQDNDRALQNFTDLLNSDSPPEVRNEIKYNIAVVNAGNGNFGSAITGFDEVITDEADPEIKLLARAGLALSCKRRLESQWSETYDSDPKIIKEQYHEIQKTLGSEEERLITDQVVTEVERIISEALEEDVKLRRPGKRKFVPALSRRSRLLIFLLFLVLFILWLYLYVGLNNFVGYR
ncbi:MAG TPA: hypothetical protein VKB05_08860 [Pyrinomonadaceae bacterium]|nr:hypothetical protein [Pyrinomonadaceae bacterium]